MPLFSLFIFFFSSLLFLFINFTNREALSASCSELVDRLNVVTHSLEETTNIARSLRRENDEIHFQTEDLARQFADLRRNLEISTANNSDVC